MSNASAPSVHGGLLVGGPKPDELRLAAINAKGQVFALQLGPGLQLGADGQGGFILRATKPMTATVVGQKAERQDDGSYVLPQPVPGAIPSQVSGHAIYSSGFRLTPGKHYTITGENNIHRIAPAAGELHAFGDEVLADYVATY